MDEIGVIITALGSTGIIAGAISYHNNKIFQANVRYREEQEKKRKEEKSKPYVYTTPKDHRSYINPYANKKTVQRFNVEPTKRDRPKYGTPEKDLQIWFIRELKLKGFTASYNNPFNDVGIPDLKISKNGVIWFIELKKDGNTPEKHQFSYMRGLRTMGANVTWLAGSKEMINWIANPTTKRF